MRASLSVLPLLRRRRRRRRRIFCGGDDDDDDDDDEFATTFCVKSFWWCVERWLDQNHRPPSYIFKYDDQKIIIQTKKFVKEEEEEEEARARRLLSFSFTWSDRSSISKGQIETEKDAIEVADRAQTYTQKRDETTTNETRNVVVLGKPLMRRVAIKSRSKRNEKFLRPIVVARFRNEEERSERRTTRTRTPFRARSQKRRSSSSIARFKKTSYAIYACVCNFLYDDDDDDDSDLFFEKDERRETRDV